VVRTTQVDDFDDRFSGDRGGEVGQDPADSVLDWTDRQTGPVNTASPAPGLSVRPLVASDARAVFELIAAQESHDIGTAEIELEDIESDWSRPSHDLATGSIGVFNGLSLVAYAETVGVDRYDAAALPSYRGRGIGTWLAQWIQARGRLRGAEVMGMPVPKGSDGDRLLASLGYFVRWTSWVLRLPAGRSVDPRPLPDGYALRLATPEDYEAVWTVIEDAFLEWSVRDRVPLADYAAQVWNRPGFEPWHLQVVTGAGGEIVGAINCWNTTTDGKLDTYVSKVAVARAHRNLGLAQVLLVGAFAAGRSRGATTGSLSTDSRTGALSLYEKVGMEPASTWLHRAIKLD
jgi:ribosomal protein S18 acetylase RimI-like enzyme